MRSNRFLPTRPGRLVVKLRPDGSGLEYGTFVDGDSGIETSDIAVDQSGSAYITGEATLVLDPDDPFQWGIRGDAACKAQT